MPVHPRYIPRDPNEPQSLTSSISVLRTSDSTIFLGAQMPRTVCVDHKTKKQNVHLATALLPTAGVPISRILNHPNIIGLIDIIHPTSQEGPSTFSGPFADLTIWEDMNAGSLAYLLPPLSALPQFNDNKTWHALSSQNFQRFSLPESLCWHVLFSISKALLWLHHGVKETAGVLGEWAKHDDDWQPILIMDVSPGQIWFQHPLQGRSTYGACKLGGFQWAKVTGSPGGQIARAARREDASLEKMYFWPPEVYKHTHAWCRASEIWALGAVLYVMMTGIPPPRTYNWDWQVSRLNDKGFSAGLREIVGDMLKMHPSDRPGALVLVDRVEQAWKRWRVETSEGKAYVDVRDEEVTGLQGLGRGFVM